MIRVSRFYFIAWLALAPFAGSAMAAEAAVAEAPKTPPPAPAKLWSWQPVQHYDPPAVKQKSWVRSPLDAFILARLEQANLQPSKEADRATFIRRATLDA